MSGPRGRDAVVAVLAAVGFAALTAAVWGRVAPGWEIDVVDRATALPDAVGHPIRLVMELGTLPAVLALAAVVWFLSDDGRAAAVVAAAGAGAWLLALQFKLVVERDRPAGVKPGEVHEGFGYPSAHAAVAFALAAAVAPLVAPRWRWLPHVLAVVVGLARLHVGVHYPLDVVGGAALGTATGLGMRAVLAR